MISAVALIVGWAGAMLFAELDILILSVPFFLLLTAAGWALIIVALLSAFRRWGRASGATSPGPP